MKLTKYLILLLALNANIFSAQDGDLDITFDGDGKVVQQSNNIIASGVAVDENGKIVICTFRPTIAGGGWNVFRYNTNGTLDIQFQSLPIVGDFALAAALAIQSDGKIVVVGTVTQPTVQFAIARYNVDGTLDTTFDAAGATPGFVTQDFGADSSSASSVAIQADGKIVVAGTAFIANINSIALARYNSDGTLDAAITTSVTDNLNTASVAIQADQKIVVAGLDGDLSTLFIARYRNNLTLDPTFNSSGATPGILIDTTIPNSEANSVAIQSDGKIVIGGRTINDFLIARYLSDGRIDNAINDPLNSFGVNGFVNITFVAENAIGRAIAIQSDGKIIEAGVSGNNFALARVNTNGTLDVTFGTGGLVKTTFDEAIGSSARAVAIQQNGYIVAAGNAQIALNTFAIAITRYISHPPLFLPTVNQPTNNTTLSGNAQNLSFLTIYDVTNPANPIVLCNPVTPENNNPTLTNGNWVCNGLDLVPGQTYNLKLVSRYKTSNVNLATLAQVTIPFPPTVTLEKTGPATILAGSFINYQIIVTNPETDTLNNVIIVDQLPEEVTFVSASNGGTFNQANNTVTFTIPTIASGETVILNIRVKSVNLAESRVITNTVTSSTGASTTFDTLLIALTCNLIG